jgi:hypothetical protein
VERVRLWPPLVKKRYDQKGGILEPCHALCSKNLNP